MTDAVARPGGSPWELHAPDSPALADLAAGWRSAYVHIPFCRRRCPYCDFAVVTPEEYPGGASVDAYVAALLAEIELEEAWGPLDAVNFGGGTPSTLDPAAIGRILDALAARFGVADGAEIGVEANPEDLSRGYVDRLASTGVNRISLGVQSFDTAVLAALGRRHTPEQATRAVEMCRAGGIGSISIDMIYGAGGESLESWKTTVARARQLDPDHLSAYALTVERGTALSRAVAAGAPAPDPDLQADMYEHLLAALEASPLVHYEISNLARTGHPCRYNLATWAQGEYVAFGLGAHGHLRGRRRRNVRRLDRYLELVAGGRRPEAGAEQITGWEAEKERLLLGLRRRAGVVVGEAGRALLRSDAGRRLKGAGVVELVADRLVVRRPLLTDAVNRAVLDLAEPRGVGRFDG